MPAPKMAVVSPFVLRPPERAGSSSSKMTMPTANTAMDAMINSRAFFESIAWRRSRLRIVSIAPPAGRSSAITDTLSGDHGLPELDSILARRCTMKAVLSVRLPPLSSAAFVGVMDCPVPEGTE